jgi:predicted phosphodiesterase
MKIAIISDIHSNLQALEVCMDYIDKTAGIEYIAVLGDIVGYGPDPSGCIALVREKTEFSILGNHDSAVAGITDISYFNTVARDAVIWTKDRLSVEELEYLKSLPYTVRKDGLFFVHSSPGEPDAWKYIFCYDDASDEFDNFNEKICFIGHSHLPGIYGKNGILSHTDGAVELNPDENYIINVGSIGQPRDGDPRSSFAIYDFDNSEIEIIRLEYNTLDVRKSIIDNGLPEFLGDRLIRGH